MPGESFQYDVAIIILYFGAKFPWYFPYFVTSCQYNPEITFFIISDCRECSRYASKNVLFLYKTFEEMKQLADQRLEMKTALNNPYKLCDFRPAYAVLFSELIEAYDFWGHCDLDVIFGNIRNFITNDVLKNYDVISIRPEYISGFFALYRNSSKINRLFQRSPSYEKVFKTHSYSGFDECGLLCDALAEGRTLEELPCDIESMTHVVKKLASTGEISAYFNFHVIEGTPGNLQWHAGDLVYNDEFEVLLYHLIRFKTHPDLTIPVWEKVPTSFYITETDFSKTKSQLNAAK